MIAENRQLTNSGRHPGPYPVEEQDKHHGAGEDVGLPRAGVVDDHITKTGSMDSESKWLASCEV